MCLHVSVVLKVLQETLWVIFGKLSISTPQVLDNWLYHKLMVVNLLKLASSEPDHSYQSWSRT